MTTDFLPTALFCALGYLLGSIPFGLLLTKAAGLGDIRGIGSGNIGATNVLRTGQQGPRGRDACPGRAQGRRCGADRAGLSPASPVAMLAGLAAVLGHLFPVWLRFKGGKGVATGLAVLLAAAWPIGVTACAVWLAAFAITRISSVGALAAFASAPLAALVLGRLRRV